jgi:hypothetical protein
LKGLIRDEAQVVQAIDFKGVENNKIHPSDIDAVFEFNNELLILMEVKKKGIPIPTGQKLLLERLCDSWHNDKAVVLKVEHSVLKGAIPLSSCLVTEIYYQGSWKPTYKFLKHQLNKIGKYFNEPKCFFK